MHSSDHIHAETCILYMSFCWVFFRWKTSEKKRRKAVEKQKGKEIGNNINSTKKKLSHLYATQETSLVFYLFQLLLVQSIYGFFTIFCCSRFSSLLFVALLIFCNQPMVAFFLFSTSARYAAHQLSIHSTDFDHQIWQNAIRYACVCASHIKTLFE